MSHSTFSARQILDLVREHGITATLEDEDSVPALADAGNEDCYPTITIALSAGDWTAEVTGWKVCWWEMGPNRRDNGAWIGDGWHWLVATDDGQCKGEPRVEVKLHDDGAQTILVRPGDNVGSTVEIPCQEAAPADSLDAGEDGPEDKGEAEELADAIRDAIADVYDDWAPGDADDAAIHAALIDQRRYGTPQYAAEVETEVCGETVTVGIFAGNHAGKPVFAVNGDSTEAVFDDADDAAERARKLLRSALTDGAKNVDELDLTKVVATLNRRDER